MDLVGKKTLEIMNKAPWYNKWLFDFMKPFLRGRILEVGAGIGNFTSYLKSSGEVTAIDIDRGYVAKLKRIGGIKSGLGDIEKGTYFFKRKKFDSIVCLNVLEHIEKDNIALRNMYNLLNHNGRLILLVPAHQWAYGTLDVNLGHFRRYNKKILALKAKKAGFKVKSINYLNWFGIIGWFVNARVLGRGIIPQSQLSFFDKIARIFLIIEKMVHMPFGLSVLVIGEK